MSLTILGRDASDHTVWVDVEGDTFPLSPPELASMHMEVIGRSPFARRGGHDFDESQVTELLQAMAKGPDLDACYWCNDPGVMQSENGPICVEHATALSDAENASVESERAS